MMLTAAAMLLVVFDGSGHRVRVLPADASAWPVLLGATLLGAALTLVEQKVRRLLG
jgi:hypothetical protein